WCGAGGAAPPMRVYARARDLTPLFPAALLAPLPVPSGALPGRSLPGQSRPGSVPASGRPEAPRRRSFRCRAATDSPSIFRLRVTWRTRVRISESQQSHPLSVRDMCTALAYAVRGALDLRKRRFTPRVLLARPHVSAARLTLAHTLRTSSG